MVRNDFVSNSSSTSFIIFPHKQLLPKLKVNDIRYPEFETFLNYYKYIVFKYNKDTKDIVDKFKDMYKLSEEKLGLDCYEVYRCLGVEYDHRIMMYKYKDKQYNMHDIVEKIKKDYICFNMTTSYCDEWVITHFMRNVPIMDVIKFIDVVSCIYMHNQCDEFDKRDPRTPELQVFEKYNVKEEV